LDVESKKNISDVDICRTKQDTGVDIHYGKKLGVSLLKREKMYLLLTHVKVGV